MSRREHLAPASTADIITAGSGLALWPDAAIRAYMAKQRRRAFFAELLRAAVPLIPALGFVSILAYLFPAESLTLFAICIYPIAIGVTIWHCKDGSEWRTNFCTSDGVYVRDSVLHTLPSPILRILTRVNGILPKSRAYVSFVGRDPVLHVEVGGNRYHVVVWDENPDGSITIIKPPV